MIRFMCDINDELMQRQNPIHSTCSQIIVELQMYCLTLHANYFTFCVALVQCLQIKLIVNIITLCHFQMLYMPSTGSTELIELQLLLR